MTERLTTPILRRDDVHVILVVAAAAVLGVVSLLTPPAASPARGAPDQPDQAKPVDWSKLDRTRIPAYELKVAGGGDPAKAPAQLVAILGHSRLQHWSTVGQVVFSPDGKLLASASGDGTVRLWDVNTAEERRRLPARSMWVNALGLLTCVAFSSDGRIVAAGGFNTGAVIWDVETGREIRVLRADEPIGRIAFHPGGQILATGHELKATLWDLGTGKPLHTLAGHAKDFRRQYSNDYVSVAFTPDGTTLLHGHPDKRVRYWDVKTGKLLKTIDAHRGPVAALAVSGDGKHLATGSGDKTVSLWDLKSGELLHNWPAHEHYVQAVAFHPHGKLLATGGLDGMIKYWDVETRELKQSFRASQVVGVECLAFSPDGTMLASAGWAARIWDAATGQPRFAPPAHIGGVVAVACTADGQTLAAASAEGTVQIWDPLKQQLRRTISVSLSGLGAIAVSPDGTTLASLEAHKSQVQIWDLASGQRGQSFQAEGNISRSLAFSPDGSWLVASMLGRWEGNGVTIWDRKTGKIHGRLDAGTGSAHFSPDGKRLIVAGHADQGRGPSSFLKIWDIATLKLETERTGLGGLGQVATSALNPDGVTLAISGSLYDAADKSKEVIILWDLPKQHPRLILDCGQTRADQMAFAPDGRSLVTVSNRDGQARIWDARDGKLRETVPVCEGGAHHLRQVVFAPDSRHLITAMGNGTVYILRIQPAPDQVEALTRIDPRTLDKEPPRSDLWKDLIGKPAPEFRQIKGWLYGKPVKLADLRGRYVILHFWNLQSEYQMPALMLWREWFSEDDLSIVVVNPDFGASAEDMKKYFAGRSRDLWGGRPLPFAVALDSGGETPIDGTSLTTPGATHAAYRILQRLRGQRQWAKSLLIDPKGLVLEEIYPRADDITRRNLETLLGKAARTPAWQQRFEQLCALEPGQKVKRIAPPYPSERQDYIFYRYSPFNTNRTYLFEFDGTLRNVTMTGREQLDLSEVLNFVGGLKSFELDVSADLSKVKVVGDWVYRKDVEREELMKALQTILQKNLKLPLRLVPGSDEREVIVVRGRYQYRPLSANNADGAVHWCLDASPLQTPFGGGGSGSLQEMLDRLGDDINRRFLIQAPTPANLGVQWRDHLVEQREGLRSAGEAGVGKRKALLDNLSKQTGLEFKIERRKVKVWRVVGDQRL